jgi:competence protein ComEC
VNATSAIVDRARQAEPNDQAPRRSTRAAEHTTREVHYYPLVVVLAIVCAGIVVGRYQVSFLPHSFQLWWCIAPAALLSWFIFWRKRWLGISMIALAVAIASIGGAWANASWNLFAVDELGRYAHPLAEPVCLEAIVTSAPREIVAPPYNPLQAYRPGPTTRLTIAPVALRAGAHWRSASGKAQLNVNGRISEIHVGDRLRIFGQLVAPAPPGNPGEFDHVAQARGNRELCSVHVERPDCVTVIERGSAWNPLRWIDELRSYGDRVLWANLSHQRAGLTAAMLLGQREQVDQEANEEFVETGTVHIHCVAGLHVGILAWLLFLALRTGLVPQRAALLCVVFVSGTYMLLTSAEPPVVRATLLVWIVCGAMWLGRRGIGLNSLALAGLVVLAVNPAALFRTGVHLSFLSVAALIATASWLSRRPAMDPLDRLIAATRPWHVRLARRGTDHLRELFLVGAGMWLVVTPLVMARFHIISIAGLFLNVLLIPVVTLTMAAGFATLIFGFWLPPVAATFGWFCDLNLRLIEWSVHATDKLPGSNWFVAGPSDAWLVVFYLAVASVLFLRTYLPRLRWQVGLAGAWCGVGLLAALPSSANPEALKCTFIAVGHGGAELVELPDGRTLLYDAGRFGSPIGGARSISAYLWSKGITHVDAVVLSHADTDHYNSLPDLLERFSVGVVYVSPMMFHKEKGALESLHRSIEHSGIKMLFAHAGDRLLGGSNAIIDVLHPPPEGVVGTDNANCIVLDIQFAGRRTLLTGDLEPPGLDMVMNETRVPYDVIQIPHHGSMASEPELLALWAQPRIALISGGVSDGVVTRNSYAAHGATALNTADCGAITVTMGRDRLDVQCFRQQE